MTSLMSLRHVADVIVSNVDKKSVDGELPVRLVNYTDVYHRDLVTSDLPLMEATATASQLQRFRVYPGDSIITKDSETAADIAVPAHVKSATPDMVCGYHLAVIRPSAVVEPRYLTWALRSQTVRQQMSSLANGMTRFGISYGAINSARIPVPPPRAQRRIADFLDDQVARIDNIIAARRKQVLLLRADFDSQLQEMFDAVTLRTRPLATVTDPRRPIQYGIVLPGPDFPGGVPIVKGGDVGSGRLARMELNRTDPAIEAKYPRSRLTPGDLVIAIRGSYGEVDWVPDGLENANLTQDSARIAPYGCDPLWLRWALDTSRVQAELTRRATGAMVTGVNIESLRATRIPDVPPDTQTSLGLGADRAARGSTLLRSRLLESNARLAELKQSLITAAVTGEFDVSTADGSGVPV